MNAPEALEVVKSYLVADFEVPEEKITMEADLFDDLELDSIDALDMVGQIEAHLGTEVKDDALKSLRTIADVVNYLVEHGS